MEQCIVVIPVHSSTPSAHELISFRQCFAILGKHPISVVAPAGLDLSNYKKVVADFNVVYINPKWQSSLQQYNKLKISRYFYRLFKEYEYLLTYELDAFVFRDELHEWCKKGFDYIGAPWFDDFYNKNGKNQLTQVGNSGFSLRRIHSVMNILNTIYYPPQYIEKLSLGQKITERLKYPIRKLLNLGKENYTLQKYFNSHEDLFFAQYATYRYPDFQVAPVDLALQFSFEVCPEILFLMNENKLPFGCHAWWRYNLKFWRPHIEKFGYAL